MSRPGVRRPTSGRRGTGAATGWERAGRGRAAREGGGVDDTAAPRRPGSVPTGGAPRRPSRTEASRTEAPRADTPRTETPRAGTERPADARKAAPWRTGSVRGAGRKPGRLAGLGRTPRRPVPVRYRRRRLVAGLAAALVLLVGVGVGTRVLLYDAGLADVEDVTVSGLSTVPEQAVRDAAAVTPGGPLISVDTADIAGRVAGLEGVASVEVRRAWPHTVEVVVTERVPVALWPTPQGLFVVDGTGLPYRLAPEPPPALPRLTFSGIAPQDPSTGAALAVLHDLTDPLRAQVATVEVAGTQVTLVLGDGRSVRWGDPARAADKIAVLGPLLGQPGSLYDVSSPDLPTVRP